MWFRKNTRNTLDIIVQKCIEFYHFHSVVNLFISYAFWWCRFNYFAVCGLYSRFSPKKLITRLMLLKNQYSVRKVLMNFMPIITAVKGILEKYDTASFNHFVYQLNTFRKFFRLFHANLMMFNLVVMNIDLQWLMNSIIYHVLNLFAKVASKRIVKHSIT